MYINKIQNEKDSLRKLFKNKRKHLNFSRKSGTDAKIQYKLLHTKEYHSSKNILVYASKTQEINTFCIIYAALSENKTVALPKCNNNEQLDFYKISSTQDLAMGSFGILEPKASCQQITAAPGSLCIVPGLSFDLNGYRLGYGKGYYDRFLANFSGYTIGLCYREFIINNLPHSSFDVPVQFIITN